MFCLKTNATCFNMSMLPHKLTYCYGHQGYSQQSKPKLYSVTRTLPKAVILVQHPSCNMAGSQILSPCLTESLDVVPSIDWHLPFPQVSNTGFGLVGCPQFRPALSLAKLIYTHNWQSIWFPATVQNTTVVVSKPNTLIKNLLCSQPI